ncbi:serine/threonine protein kinase [Deinococcus sp. KNUC1210]|uniref:serine/threonine-protein kinase n=1 Tax=Deinococcus sp. KNUC1210 TaxID=2917691 RepID=UPI001EF15937|nr:serine/threonine-protein kinase [Deinococcus sp. KNUC1210]ULH16361.1 serine/threonine protein kinase [Deinococcus sp. KNUC1210]
MKLSAFCPTLEYVRPIGFRAGVEQFQGQWQGQCVFVKRLQSAEELHRQQLLHEGQIAGRLSHPLIVPLLTRSRQELVFQFVEGCTLRQLIDAGPLAPEVATRLIEGLLEALIYLHAEGVVHHDLKPENVMLDGCCPEQSAVRLIDFGMAFNRQANHDTHAGTRMGTPHFMAPEQFQGVRGDARSDLYALGVLFWDALAGQPPHEDPLSWLIGLPSERGLVPGPPELHPLLLRSLHRDPEQRFQSAEEMLATLRQTSSIRTEEAS